MNRKRPFSIVKVQMWGGIFLIAVFVVIALAAPMLAPPPENKEFSPYREVVEVRGFQPNPPGNGTLLGTVHDQATGYQLDIWYSLVWGTRSALIFGVGVVAITATIGILIGAMTALAGGTVNLIGMGITDAFLALPVIAGVVFFQQFILALLRSTEGTLVYASNLVYFMNEVTPYQTFLTKLDPIAIAFVALSWMPYARVLNSVVIRIRREQYIQAATALGASPWHLLIQHIIPNSISSGLVLIGRDIGYIVLLQAGFAFIGLTDLSVWGSLLSAGRDWIIAPGANPLTYWWVFLPATLAIVFFGMGWNLLGDAINDWISRHTR